MIKKNYFALNDVAGDEGWEDPWNGCHGIWDSHYDAENIIQKMSEY